MSRINAALRYAMPNITITTEGLGDATLRELNILFNSPRGKTATNAAGGRAVQSFLRKYHTEFGRAGKWTNPSLPTWGRGRKSTRFATQIASGWQKPVSDASGTTITHNDVRLGHKIDGGTIKSSSGKNLTIPVRPDAHGKSVNQWKAENPKKRLFKPRGRNYLAFALKSGQIRVVYLLKKQVVQRPWGDAMPGDQMILDAWFNGDGGAHGGVSERIDEAISRLGTKAKTDK